MHAFSQIARLTSLTHTLFIADLSGCRPLLRVDLFLTYWFYSLSKHILYRRCSQSFTGHLPPATSFMQAGNGIVYISYKLSSFKRLVGKGLLQQLLVWVFMSLGITTHNQDAQALEFIWIIHILQIILYTFCSILYTCTCKPKTLYMPKISCKSLCCHTVLETPAI